MFSHWTPDYFAIYHNWFKIQIQCKVHTEYRPGKCEVLIFLKSIFKRGQNFSLVEDWAGVYGRQTLKEQYHKVLTLVFLAELTPRNDIKMKNGRIWLLFRGYIFIDGSNIFTQLCGFPITPRSFLKMRISLRNI